MSSPNPPVSSDKPVAVESVSPAQRAAQLQAAGVTGLSFVRSMAFGPAMVEVWQLANGLQLLLARDTAAHVAAVHTWVKTGSADEVAGKSGLAHLFEHLMFKSTTTRPAGTFDRELERFGASANAATWYDWTMYHEVVPAAQVAMAIELEADRLDALALTPAAVRSELEVVRNERRETVDDDPDGQVDEALWRAAFGEHPYGRPVIGSASDLERLGLDDAVAFYRARYVPAHIALVVVGGFDPDAVLRAAAQHHGSLRATASAANRPPPPQAKTVAAQVDLPIDASAARLAVAWRTVSLSHADHAALALAAEALCGADSARWYRTLVDDERIASAVSCTQSDLRLDGLFEVRLTLRPGQRAKDAERRVDALLQAVLGAQPLSDAEVRGARLRLQTGRLRELASVDGRAEVLGSTWATRADLADGERWWQRLLTVSAAEANQALRRWLVAGSRVTVRAEPAAPPPPSTLRRGKGKPDTAAASNADGERS